MTEFLTRIAAAGRIAARLGVPYSPRSLEKAPIPYRLVNARAAYAPADVDAFAERLLTEAPRRIGRPGAAPTDAESNIAA